MTLSATPIPRTLYLALMGARDMSLINTPPRDRLPIHTELCAFSKKVLVEAILRELHRGGQVFFVHNRVQTIEGTAKLIRELLPNVRVAWAHGQMQEEKLEGIMTRFLKHEFDVLVATAIIESGLDMPRVNTIIIDRADRFGLAQLYQLRGRVGRSNHRAFAYLMTPPGREAHARGPPPAGGPGGIPGPGFGVSHRHARPGNPRVPATCWAKSSTGTWRPSDSTSTAGCWRKPWGNSRAEAVLHRWK